MQTRLAFLTLVCCCYEPMHGIAQESAKEVVATQIRSQGYHCDHPMAAERLPQQSRPEETAWLIKCESASYRVRLIPHMAALVELVTEPQ
jgi:hypothetical protein